MLQRYSILILLMLQNVISHNILAVLPFSGKSYYINTKFVLRELVKRGHHVTVINTYTDDFEHPNFKQIIVEKIMFWESVGESKPILHGSVPTYEETMRFFLPRILKLSDLVLNSTNLRDFIINDKTHFDLILMQIIFQPVFYMFAHKYKAPVVGIHTMGYSNYVGFTAGNPLQLSYSAHVMLCMKRKLNMWNKIRNIYVSAHDAVLRRIYLQRFQRLAEKHFESLEKPLPFLGDLEKNMSIIFMNTHFSHDTVRAYVPSVVEIGGIHIQKNKPLPKALKEFLDNSTCGAIFFSLGSNTLSKKMPAEKIQMLLKVFARLKQRVVWKFEDANLEGKSDNVLTGEWLPQNDILAHPNIKMFITHGGLLSTQEALYHGVPTIGLPVMADQFLNSIRQEELGAGLMLEFTTLTEHEFEETLYTILNDSRYHERAKELSSRFKDRQNSAMDTMIYWMEYVIRHKGATFLRTPDSNDSFFEYFMLDIVFVAMLSCFGIIVFAYMVIKMLCKLLCYKRNTKNNLKQE